MALTTSPLATNADAPTELQLLRCFELRRGMTSTPVPLNVQRLLAYLALNHGPQHRTTVAGTLWIETTEEKASANLRTAIWRARRVDPALVCSAAGYLRLGEHVRIDLTDLVTCTRRLLEEGVSDDPSPSIDSLSDDLLPEWYDDWVLLERERLRQIRLHGLEALCLRLAGLGHYAMAIEAGLVAVSAEPLRESTHRALIRAHLAEGNMAEAVRQYDAFTALLLEHLGIGPSAALRALVAPCR